RAENEIDVAGNITIFEVLPSAVHQYRVLPAEKTAFSKNHPVAIDADGQGLPYRTGRVLESDVLGGEVVGINNSWRGAEGSARFPVRPDHVRLQVVGQNSLLRRTPDQVEEPFFVLDINQFLIDARFDVDIDLVGRTSGRHNHDGFLHRFVWGASVR